MKVLKQSYQISFHYIPEGLIKPWWVPIGPRTILFFILNTVSFISILEKICVNISCFYSET